MHRYDTCIQTNTHNPLNSVCIEFPAFVDLKLPDFSVAAVVRSMMFRFGGTYLHIAGAGAIMEACQVSVVAAALCLSFTTCRAHSRATKWSEGHHLLL